MAAPYQTQSSHRRTPAQAVAVFSPVPDIILVDREPAQEESDSRAQDWALALLVVSLLGVCVLYALVNQ